MSLLLLSIAANQQGIELKKEPWARFFAIYVLVFLSKRQKQITH